MSASDNFVEAAGDYQYTIHRPEPFSVAQPVDDMPPFSPFAYAAFDLVVDAISPPIESRGTYYIIQVLERSPVDEEEFENRAPAIGVRLRQEKVRAYLSYWYDQLKENAEIEDYRGGV
jgi:hypothetical protein